MATAPVSTRNHEYYSKVNVYNTYRTGRREIPTHVLDLCPYPAWRRWGECHWNGWLEIVEEWGTDEVFLDVLFESRRVGYNL